MTTVAFADYHSSIFGGSVTVEEEPGTYTYHTSTFGGSVIVEEESNPSWSNWSSVWKIGQTSYTDINLDMQVDYLDASNLTGYYGDSGDAGWINADINDDGDVDYLDASSLTGDYGSDYT